MNPNDIAIVCLNNNGYRFNAILKWMDTFPNYWNINDYVDIKASPSKELNNTTCLLIASKYSDPFFVSELLFHGASAKLRDPQLEGPLHKAVQSNIGPVKKASLIISHEPSSINSRNKRGLTPLHYIAKSKTPQLIQLLIDDHRTNVNARTQKLLTPLHVAAHFGNAPVVRILLTHTDIDVNATDYLGDTPAHHSAYYGHLDVYVSLRSHSRYDPIMSNHNGLTAEVELFHKLLDACLSGSGKVVKEYVEKCNVPLKIGRHTKTALHQSCRSNVDGLEKVRFIIGKEPNVITQRLPRCGSQAVHLASQNKDHKILKELANHYVTDINAMNARNMTPMHITCLLGYTEHVKLLLKKDIDINALDTNKNTPLHFACQKGHLDIILALKSDPCCRMDIENAHGKVSDELTPYSVRVHEHAIRGDADEMEAVIDRTESFECDNQGNSALHSLSKSNKDIERKAHMLIECDHSQVSKLNGNGLMPIHLSIKHENIPLSVFLVRKYGRDFQTSDGRFPLHIAAQYDITNIAQLLLEISSYDEVNAKDLNGNTAAHLASLWGSNDTLTVIENNPKYNKYISNKEGKKAEELNPKNIALVRLCKHGTVSSVASMLQDGARPLNDAEGNNILCIAYTSTTDRLEKCQLLVQQHPSLVSDRNRHGETLLHMATKDEDVEFIKYIIAQDKININAINNRNMTPIHCAIDSYNTDIVKCFLKHGADINIKNELGRACVHTCVARNQTDILRELLTVESIDVNTKDEFGRSPFELAVEGGHRSTVWSLATHPAFMREHLDTDASQVLASYGKLTDLTVDHWRMTRALPVRGRHSPSLDLVHGHLCHSSEYGITVYDRELSTVASYRTHVPAAYGDMELCRQAAALDQGRLVVAESNGLYCITHTGVTSRVCSGMFKSVQHHSGNVYAALWDSDRGHSYVLVYDTSVWPWQLEHEFRIPCDAEHFITLCVNDAHIYVCCLYEDVIYTLTHDGVIERTLGRIVHRDYDKLYMPFLCHSDSEDTLLVANYYDRRLRLLLRGAQWQPTRVMLPQDVRPYRAVYTPGRLYMLGWDHRTSMDYIWVYEKTH